MYVAKPDHYDFIPWGSWFSPDMTDTSIRVDNLPLRGETWLEVNLVGTINCIFTYIVRIRRNVKGPE